MLVKCGSEVVVMSSRPPGPRYTLLCFQFLSEESLSRLKVLSVLTSHNHDIVLLCLLRALHIYT